MHKTMRKLINYVFALFAICFLFGTYEVSAATVHEVEPNETKQEATVVSVGDWFEGGIGKRHRDVDYVKLELTEGKSYVVEMTNYYDFFQDTTMLVSVITPSGYEASLIYGLNSFTHDSKRNVDYVTWYCHTGGTYYIKIENYHDTKNYKDHPYKIGFFYDCDRSGHHFGYYTTVKRATCADEGEKKRVCMNCGKIETVSIAKSKVHSYGGYTIIDQATYAKAGVKEHTCKYCGKVETVIIPKLTPKAIKLSGLIAAKKGFTAKWKKGKDISGYELQYALNKGFTKSKKSIIIKNPSTAKKKIKRLKAKKKYYVRIRTYKTYNGKKYHSKWSKSKSIKTK